MSKQAQVGVFAILALLLLFGVFFIITDFATRHTGYRVGIHFNGAAGLHSGALVYFSGVTVGSVDSIALLPDNTVDVILAINKDVDIPSASKFLIQAPLTGDPSLIIVPPIPPQRPKGYAGPTPAPAAQPVLAREVLPIDEQPQGQNTATIADLLEQGQGEVKRLDTMLATLEDREPRLLNTMQSAMDNANQLTANANQAVSQLSGKATAIADTLQGSLDKASANIVSLTDTLNTTVASNSGKVDSLLTTLNSTAVSLNTSVDSLKQLATNPDLKRNIIDTTQNIADTTKTIAYLAGDLRQITGNPQTQAQVRDTVANLDATMEKANSLLGELGGTSHVYGVDAGATPAPPGAPAPAAPPRPGSQPPVGSQTAQTANLKNKVGAIAKNLIALQIRVGELSPQHVVGTNPLLSSDRGPQTDVNLLLLPKGNTSLWTGANDIGARTTYNFAALQRMSPGVTVGGGILYSRLGVLGRFDKGPVGVEGRAYDLRRPTLDGYLNLHATPFAKVFFGERDLSRPERRTVFGLELQF